METPNGDCDNSSEAKQINKESSNDPCVTNTLNFLLEVLEDSLNNEDNISTVKRKLEDASVEKRTIFKKSKIKKSQNKKSSHELSDSDADESNQEESDAVLSDKEDSDEALSDDGDEEEEESSNEEEEAESTEDPYVKHFEYVLPEKCTEAALNPQNERLKYKLTGELEMPGLGQMNFFKMFPDREDPVLSRKKITDFPLKKNLLSSICEKKELSALELSFLNILTNYIDVIYCKEQFKVREKLRRAYCIHLLNHILKSKARVIHHNSKMRKNPEAEYRDQGFTQSTVLILVPFRGDCFRIVNLIISLLPKKCKVMNKSRFEKEYGPTGERKSKSKPEDFYEIFDGNNNEDFKIGLRIQNEHVTLYSNFYKSDLIIASPLGLRPIIGDTDNKNGDADFLSSIEVFIIDRLDVLMVQNPIHLGHILLCMNHLVKKEHANKKINYFRVREYILDKKAKYYRQNIYLSSTENASFIYNYYMSHCFNYEGHMRSHDWVLHPVLHYIYPEMQICFRILDSENPQQELKDRKTFFVEKILPNFVNDKSTVQTLIYIPSYFDYVELRHHFREAGISCFMMCEYTDKGKKAQGRDLFYKGHRHFMLYTERTHFYFRHWIKGIQHVIFYKLPTFPSFFREICNSLMDSHPKRQDEERTCTAIVSPRDFLQLKHIVGLKDADRMLKSKQKIFTKYVGS